jgi:hypothetical protein
MPETKGGGVQGVPGWVLILISGFVILALSIGSSTGAPGPSAFWFLVLDFSAPFYFPQSAS